MSKTYRFHAFPPVWAPEAFSEPKIGTERGSTYFPSGSVSSVHSFKRLPLNFHGNLHSAFLSALSLVVRHISPEMKKFILKNPTNIQFSPNKSRNVPIGNLFSPINMNNISHKVPIISTVLINVTDLIFEIVRHVYLKTYGKFSFFQFFS